MGVLWSSLAMSCKPYLLLMISVIVVQLHNAGVSGLPSPWSADFDSEPWYMTNHPAHLSSGHLTPGNLSPGYLTPRKNGRDLQVLMNKFKNYQMKKFRNRPGHLIPYAWCFHEKFLKQSIELAGLKGKINIV